MKKLSQKVSVVSSVLLAMLSSIGCSNSPSTEHIPAVENFVLARYMGRWYEIARLPHSFEKNITDPKADYSLQDDGTVKVINSGLRNGQLTSVSGTARNIADDPTSGELEVSFFYPFYGLYKIIFLNKNYDLAIVTSSSMDYVWILARQPVITNAELAQCLKMLDQWGFAVKLLQYPSGMIEVMTIKTVSDVSTADQ